MSGRNPWEQGSYEIKLPLVKKSRLTSIEKGGIGKELSDGWVANYAIGCTFGCVFCYVDSIHKRFGSRTVGGIVKNEWGGYFSVPSNIDSAIEQTEWSKWKGVEILLSILIMFTIVLGANALFMLILNRLAGKPD